MIEALKQGLLVRVVPGPQTVTFKQAAELLDVSHPTPAHLLDAGLVPYDQASRRTLFRDVLAYRTERIKVQYRELDAISFDIDEGDDIKNTLASLRKARRHQGVLPRLAPLR